ncbi:MAG: putative porin [Prevotellaceae bacterium]|nr:putative porin [Prevotellaceae bacterium]
MGRRIVWTYLFLFVIIGTAGAQETLYDANGNQIDPTTRPNELRDSLFNDVESPAPKLYMWTLEEKLGERNFIPADTASFNFQNTNLVEGMTGQYNYLANLGSPRLSRVFFERRDPEPTIFLEPLSSFYQRPGEMKFTNSNVPYTNLTYYKAGSKINGEERFRSYFSVNAGKETAVGFLFDYLYGHGYYQNSATAHFNAGLFASYIGERYQMHVMYNNYFFKMNENGGIMDDQYITRPENMAEGKRAYESTTIPVNLDGTSNRNHDFFIYLTHRYRVGFTRTTTTIKERQSAPKPEEEEKEGNNEEIGGKNEENVGKVMADSLAVASLDSTAIPPVLMDTIVTEEFVPVTSFIHTLKVERSRHRYTSKSESAGDYDNTYFDDTGSRDTTVAISVKNLFGIALLEGFNKYAKSGLTAYISHKFSRYYLMDMDTAVHRRKAYTEQEIYVGGELSKRQGQTLHYNVDGELGIMGKALGQFRVNGQIDLNFHFWKDTLSLRAKGLVENTLPSFYMRHYHSNHFAWDNDDLDKEFRTRVWGELEISRWGTFLQAGVENVKNYTYFNQNSVPTQESGNIQVLSAILRQNFHLGVLHLDNEVVWQKSSNARVLPLPQLSLYHNLYLLGKVAKKVLTVQLGADVRYFTKYYAPGYTPAIQQFRLQPDDDLVEIGGYPIVNVYANVHLKHTRIFVMMYHVNQGMGEPNYFLVPHYPINPRLFKIGISWNFYD